MPWVVTLIIIPMTVWFVLGYLRNPGEGEKGKVALPVFFIMTMYGSTAAEMPV